MSNPPPAPEDTLPDPLVTPAAPAHHDCSKAADRAWPIPRHHLSQDQHLSQGAQQAPSPSRAESPTATHRWSQPASSFALKRTPTIPLEKFARPDSFHSPQLSERDSIFATHYITSDSGANTPQFPPDKAPDNERPVNLTSDLDEVSRSPSPRSKVSPHHSHVDSSHMEVDVHRHFPLRSPPLFSPPDAPRLSLLRSSISSADPVIDQAEAGAQSVHLGTLEETGTKPGGSQNALAERSLLPSVLDDVSESPQTLTPTSGPDWPMVNSEGVSYTRADPSRSIGLERSSSRGRRSRMDSSIEADLSNVEPASHVRSRKSSHYLGLFKENTTTSPDRKRWEDRGKHHDEHPDSKDRGMDLEPQVARLASEEEGLIRKSISLPMLGEGPSFESQQSTETTQQAEQEEPLKRHPPALPRSLLEEIRNFHLTPGGGRGSSFSKSIPTQYAERGRDYFQKEAHVERFHESFSSLDEEGRERRGSAQSEDDEEENEQISSAVYFPHERVTVPEDIDVSEPLAADSRSTQSVQLEKGHELMLVPQERSPSPEQNVGHVDISFRSKNESKVLHGELGDIRPPAEGADKSLSAISERSYDSTCESEAVSADESGHSLHEESSLTDDAELTPTATPTQRPRLPPKRKTAGPLGAVELKPYRHQVGGHTTVFRFSRRAVCKQLNNRENEFYERIERRHPDMLVFLPRYIGVLNVTFSKTSKRSKNHIEHTGTNISEPGHSSGTFSMKSHSLDAPEPQRIVSQKQVTGVIPKVILENNRHIIPADLFSPPKRFQTSRLAPDPIMDRPRSADGLGKLSTDSDPSELRKRAKIWGATTVNRKLQEQVLREVFSPPAIHHHRRHPRGHIHLPRATSDIPRRRGNYSEDHASSIRPSPLDRVEALQTNAMDIQHSSKEGPTLSSSASTALDENRLAKVKTVDQINRSNSLNSGQQVRRRHSGGGLQRRGSLNSHNTGDLMFFDDEGYGGDREDEIFSMEGDAPVPHEHAPPNRLSKSPSESTSSGEAHAGRMAAPRKLSELLPRPGIDQEVGAHLPSNPKEAQLRKDERVQFFLLLEDLTAGMNKPCVLDLKMGTRQYGIEATEKKKKSQRRKCQSTTSRQLGVRLCGMQAWNVKKQEYLFEDKYFGRDLKSGREFQDALTRFLYDGVSYASVAKKIPVILEKLSLLEHMIRKLDRYRLYASSLLILYDGEQATPLTPPQTPSHTSGDRPAPRRRVSDDGHNNVDVQLKIVDFANCVTGEDELPPDTPCPPHYPQDIDRGYLRGLRTLRMYFQRIMKEITQDEFVERGEGEAIALGSQPAVRELPSDQYWDESIVETDIGEVSF
ncbi:hypothetical protein N7462_004426 [Penicillium macrosclerotiorum]|uniref:uncharacterized protein n=1 Tax=Penicillium macrosclerotiorum TaxID=303699 RepID=UPI0025475DCB|nr:uncharacterized protein N7462_004426 [Penicillium macrosclerotiorum]KAJ5690034.1 hypothetical protein N7462_004426 [Penicillium macrosclerotiorum]